MKLANESIKSKTTVASQSEEEVHQNNEKYCQPSSQFYSRPEISSSKPDLTQKTELIGNSQWKLESNKEQTTENKQVKNKEQNSNSSKVERFESKKEESFNEKPIIPK